MTYFRESPLPNYCRYQENLSTCRQCGGYKISNDSLTMSRGRKHKLMLILLMCIIFFVLLTYKMQICVDNAPTFRYIKDNLFDKRTYHYTRNMPFIFIGGVPRSGTTLMRAMLDAHPDIRCGQETRVIPRLLQMRQHWMRSSKESMRLSEAGISKEVLNSAVAAFILEIIVKHGEPAARLCNKDPLTLKNGDYLIELFPSSKFIFMVRDGRATVHSIIARKVTITGFDLNDYGQCLKKWNEAITVMYRNCLKIGPERCMIVFYEQLVLYPEIWMKQILQFLNIPWHELVLHHDQLINKPGGVVLSKVERSSDQVIKPINLEGLTKWVGQFPEDVLKDAVKIAPMLARLGYDPYNFTNDLLHNNTISWYSNTEIWQERAKNLLMTHWLNGLDTIESNVKTQNASLSTGASISNPIKER